MTAKDQGFDVTVIFSIFMGLAGPIGVTIVMQNAVIGEKRSGTAAWILSKPVSRQSFILSKFIANTLGIAVTMVLAQGLIAYLITGLVVGQWVPPLDFLAALGALFVNILFYLTLTLMLGVLFEHPAPGHRHPDGGPVRPELPGRPACRDEPGAGERCCPGRLRSR